MTADQQKFGLYLTVLRFLAYKVTNNLQQIYLDIDLPAHKMLLTAYYLNDPSELELELLDDLETDSNAHIPDMFVEKSVVKLVENYKEGEKHDFTVFAVFVPYE